MNEKQSEPDLSLRAQRRKPTPAPHTPAPGAVIPAEPATASDPAGGYAPLARRGAPTVALNVRVPEAIRDAVRREAATNPATPSQAAVIEALVRAHLMN
ncbi:hypothetical protein KM867_10775 [Micrococcus luteus]|uniref:hypothetical protein n=1 Tax=Micrococcus luteus TaxID=1270 RepID=UPI001C20FDEE|nr:hypothetical protein [Micrococcus luteus]MBU8651099.1 hypothetical protein [Micrococcus luteus]